jgi:hypothetical protein
MTSTEAERPNSFRPGKRILCVTYEAVWILVLVGDSTRIPQFRVDALSEEQTFRSEVN